MNRDLFLSILTMDSYNRGYDAKLSELKDAVGAAIGDASIVRRVISTDAASVYAGFYALAYDWNGETIISYRGTDGLNDITQGWTTGAGWTDQAQSDLAVQFYNAATGRDAFDVAIPANVTLTGQLAYTVNGVRQAGRYAPELDAAGNPVTVTYADGTTGTAQSRRDAAAGNDNGAWREAPFRLLGAAA